ncbi:MAG: hypothetical protein J07HQW1_03066 [Haloquadratum walsbyi J07HQW1]|uniref:Uncharacterized protein n=1 Tax=Haloquadratum walsbyi J07HQW1 TaxID=1238424 RepID=U1N907_9EURY|nr:MAG: hypothetical protein J07HQW1_03066 [Haloquadratum walsbyi J07HQW1]
MNMIRDDDVLDGEHRISETRVVVGCLPSRKHSTRWGIG